MKIYLVAFPDQIPATYAMGADNILVSYFFIQEKNTDLKKIMEEANAIEDRPKRPTRRARTGSARTR